MNEKEGMMREREETGIFWVFVVKVFRSKFSDVKKHFAKGIYILQNDI